MIKSSQSIVEYVAKADSLLKAQEQIRAGRAAMTAEERKAADAAKAAAKDREDAYKSVVVQMREEEARGRAIQKMIDDVEKTEAKAASERKGNHRDWLQDLASINQAYSLVQRIGTAAFEDIEFAAKRARSENAALGVDLDKLSTAAHGLQTRTELLADAAKFNNSMVAMTADQMEIAEHAIVHYTRAGYDNADAHRKVLDAVVSLKTEGLQDLGTHIDKSGLSMDSGRDRAVLFRREMKALADVSKDVKDGQDSAGEATERSAVKLKDAWDSVKVSIGKLAESLAPLVDALAKIVGYVAKIVDDAKKGADTGENGGWWEGVGALVGGVGGQYVGRGLAAADRNGVMTAKNFAIGTSTLSGFAGGTNMQNVAAAAYGVDGNYMDFLNQLGKIGDQLLDGVKATTEAAKDAASPSGKKRKTDDNSVSAAELYQENKQIVDMWLTMLKTEFVDPVARFGNTQKDAFTGNAGLGYGENGFSSWDPEELDVMKQQFQMTYVMPLKGLVGDTMNQFGDALSPGGTRTPTILERMFGKVEDFDIYKEAWGELSKTIGQSYDVIVAGSDGVQHSIKMAFAGSIEALGKKMFIEGLEMEALAIGDVFWNPAKAAGEAASGALLLAGSVAAGIAAHELGYGSDSNKAPAGGGRGGGGGGSSSSSSGGGSGGNGGSGVGSTIVVVMGSDGDGETARQKQTRAMNIVDSAFARAGRR
jgi:uncharacterized membrane protein YgcG